MMKRLNDSSVRIKAGDIVQGRHWPEPIEVKLIQELGDYVRIVGQMRISGQHAFFDLEEAEDASEAERWQQVEI